MQNFVYGMPNHLIFFKMKLLLKYPVITKAFPWLLSDGIFTWIRHDMETFSTLLALCEGNPLFSGLLSQKASIGVLWWFFYVSQNGRLNKQFSWWWFRDVMMLLWRHVMYIYPATLSITNMLCISFIRLVLCLSKRRFFQKWQRYTFSFKSCSGSPRMYSCLAR